MKPAIPLHDKRFAYVPALNTDIRKTFAKARAGLLPSQAPAKVKS